MKKLRLLLKPISFLMAFAILFISCSKENVSLKKETFSGEDLYKSIFFGNGEFAQNISLLKENSRLFNQLSTENQKKIGEQINLILSYISKKDESFFRNFKNEITSGNHNNIKSAINSGGEILKESISELFPQIKAHLNTIDNDLSYKNLNLSSKESFNTYVNSLNPNKKIASANLLNKNMIATEEEAVGTTFAIAVVAAVYFAAAVHNTIAVTALVYFKAAFWSAGETEEIPEFEDSIDDFSLKAELLVDEIANYGNAE